MLDWCKQDIIWSPYASRHDIVIGDVAKGTWTFHKLCVYLRDEQGKQDWDFIVHNLWTVYAF